MNNEHIRSQFAALRRIWGDDRPTLDIIGASFTVTEETIFGAPNRDYIAREIEWYKSQSPYVDDIPGGPPKIWRDVASAEGMVNSNYGALLYGSGNGQQYLNVLAELRRDPDSRRAVAIYTRPTMHVDQAVDGMQDFVCTNAVHYRITDGELDVVVQMRSNDAVFGFRNDYAWQRYVQRHIATQLGLDVGVMTWQAASLHIYPRHFHLVDQYMRTGWYSGAVAKAA